MTQKTRWSILEIDPPYYACRSRRAFQTTATSLPMIWAIARLNVPQTLVAISFELAILMAAAAWATEPGASHLAIFTFAVLLGGGDGFVHLYLGWRAHQCTLGVATALPFVVFGGLFIYAKLIETRTLSWTLAAASFVLGTLVMLPLIRAARWVGLTFA